ncbi:TolC family protein [Pedobacter sp. MC2016-24]|uniref:TolC family protein n=1 Tax=Pedobacter sp. MC2016-24 TaxID=2780090 RepID=UPI001880F61A|nr:TolC family protein [Pedobacter sp. MC2016-24]MBE9601157.1 TolC family protein [Pedobacter sp. MC2016-24]
MNLNKITFLLLMAGLLPASVFAQADSTGLDLTNANLSQVINYALKNKPGVKQALIDQEIGERDIKSALSGWLPQINADANFNHNLKQQVNALTTNGETSYITFGTKNTSALTLQADQQFLNAGLIQASKSAKYYRQQYSQTAENVKINTIVEVSKAFYDILTSQEQFKIIAENIARLEKQFRDAKAQYEVGLVDKTDYQRAQISLSNSKADQKRTQELLKYKYAYLKSLIGYKPEKDLSLAFNNEAMEQNVLVDTAQVLNHQNRIEYRLLQTQRELQHISTSYNKLAYMPKLSGFVNYSWNYMANDFSKLYDQSFPGAIVGLKLNIPIFQGGKRTQEIRKSQLLEKRIDLDLENSKNQINSQYEQAMATYKASLNDWRTAHGNVDISKQVYGTIKLQYDEGIKTYLDLMTAESDLRTAQLNYLNALYTLLSAKLDVQQALGTITITQ